jgi:hypothetical protein
VSIPPTLAAQLASLTQSLDEPGDLEANVHALAQHLSVAVGSYLGLTMAVVVDGYEISFTVHEDTDRIRQIANSLRIPLDGHAGADPGSSLVLYAANPGAFVDLAADLGFALGLGPDSLQLDGHLHAPPPGFDPAGLAIQSTINQAVGVLIDRGHTAESARAEMRRPTDRGSGDLLTAANRILDSNPPRPPTL